MHSHADRIRALALELERAAIARAVRAELAHFSERAGPAVNEADVRRVYEDFRLQIPVGHEPWGAPGGPRWPELGATDEDEDQNDSEVEDSEYVDTDSEDEDWESETELGDDEDDEVPPDPPWAPRREIPNPLRRPIHPRALPELPLAPQLTVPDPDNDSMPALEPIESDLESSAGSDSDNLPELEDVGGSESDSFGFYAPIPAPPPVIALLPLVARAADPPPLEPEPEPEPEAAPAVSAVTIASDGRVRNMEMVEARERAARIAEARIIEGRWEDVD